MLFVFLHIGIKRFFFDSNNDGMAQLFRNGRLTTLISSLGYLWTDENETDTYVWANFEKP